MTVHLDLLNSPAAAEYFTRADRRTLTGLRYTLELLGIPLPDYAHKRPTGRPPAKAILDAFHRDNPGLKPDRRLAEAERQRACWSHSATWLRAFGA